MRNLCLTLTVLTVLLTCTQLRAGGGPENVAVVVNVDSWPSLTVANEFINLRRIPACNVIYLSLPLETDFATVNVNVFRDNVLTPVMDTLRHRNLLEQIDCITYSTDLPYAVDCGPDSQGLMPKTITTLASATGLTFLHQRVLAKDGSYLSLKTNRYFRQPVQVDTEAVQLARLNMALVQLMDAEEFEKAQRLVVAMIKVRPSHGGMHYTHGCILAQLGKADEAMAELRLAFDNGYSDAGRMSNDNYLKSLRERNDFKELLEKSASARRQSTTAAATPNDGGIDVQQARGFKSVLAFNSRGEVDTLGQGERYMLSTFLAWTSGRGNSVREALECLQRSAAADGTKPNGEIYYILNSDVRSSTRKWGFTSAIQKLKSLGIKGEVFEAVGNALPQDRIAIAGIMAGSADFNFASTGSTIMPGAICEHLTSFGGMLTEGSGQTPLTEWIRCGAAGSSGTVTEPYAIQDKFPTPFLHVHYAAGCSLAEAFYQSIQGPYQLMVLGDPLCRPWARIPQVQVQGVSDGQTVKGLLNISASVADPKATPVTRWELFVDGRRFAAADEAQMELDTTQLGEGWHELRVVGIVDGLIATQGNTLLNVQVNNQNRSGTSEITGAGDLVYGQAVVINAAIKGAKQIYVLHNERVIRSADGESARIEFDSRLLGMGKVRIQTVGVFNEADGQRGRIYCRPITLNIQPPAPLVAIKPADDTDQLVRGALLTLPRNQMKVAGTTGQWLSKAGAKPGDKLTLEGYIVANEDTVHQFQVLTDGQYELTVDGKQIQPLEQNKGWQFLPVNLLKGHHYVVVRFSPGPRMLMELRYGCKGTYSMPEGLIRHMPTDMSKAWERDNPPKKK